MFQTAELGCKISNKEYNKRVNKLRHEMLIAQKELREYGEFPVIILFAGVDGAGKGQTINLLNEWMDTRWLITRAYNMPSDEEMERPDYWRYWRDLPPNGLIGLFLSSWYSKPMLDHVYGKSSSSVFIQHLDRINTFENMLADDGVLILKFWMHLSHSAQKRRFKSLQDDPLTSWRVTERDWKHWKMYDQFLEAAEKIIIRTNSSKAQWKIIEGEDFNYRSLTVATDILDSIRNQLTNHRLINEVKNHLKENNPENTTSTIVEPINQSIQNDNKSPHNSEILTILDSLDMSMALSKKSYQQQLKEYQAKLSLLCRKATAKKLSTILVFEGPDAAGKGGAIRRIILTLDARNYQVRRIAEPTDEEKSHHYLWRFWRHLSRSGRLTVYDRSWYGRVLVERVEGYASDDSWNRAYTEINCFEEELINHGILLMKYWIHITKAEQYARFKAREETPHKRWKLTEEDWRNREKWDEYQLAVNDMVQYTSTLNAPWVLVEGNDKRYARVRVLETLCQALENKLGKD